VEQQWSTITQCIYIAQKKSQAPYSPITGISGLKKNVLMQLILETPYESIWYKERPEQGQNNTKMLEEMQNKYVGELSGSLKETCYMIWKNNLDEIKVENLLKASISTRWDFNRELTYVKTAMGLLSLVDSKC
jgi:hypothetical protein